jgi:hypothetical protein
MTFSQQPGNKFFQCVTEREILKFYPPLRTHSCASSVRVLEVARIPRAFFIVALVVRHPDVIRHYGNVILIVAIAEL